MWCCVDDGGFWPSGAALRGEASNRLMLRWLKTVVVSDEEKAPVRRQVGIRKTIAAEASKINQMTSKPGHANGPGMSLAGGPLTGQAVSGVEAT